MPLVFYDEANITVAGIGAKVRRLMADADREGKKVGAVFVDYLQLVKPAKKNHGSREGEVAEVSRSLKLLAKEIDVPIVVLAKLNREGEKGGRPERPKLSNLRESGSIEQDADIVVFIHREGFYDPKVPDDVAEIIIAKGRNIAKGTVKVRFEGKHTRFGKLEISEHAVERFLERFEPGWDYAAARAHLETRAPEARKLPHKTALGQVQYQLDEPPCILVTKRSGGDDVLTCVTVLDVRGARGESPLTEVEIELLEELAARPPPKGVSGVPKALAHEPNATVQAFLDLQRRRLDAEVLALRAEEKAEPQRLHVELARLAAENQRQRTLRHEASLRMHQEAKVRRSAFDLAMRFLLTRESEGDVEAARTLTEIRLLDRAG